MNEKTLVKQLEKIFIQKGFLSKREIGVGYGVADLVLVKLNPKKCSIRANNKQYKKLFKEEFFKILQYLPNQQDNNNPVSLDLLIKKTELSRAYLKYNLLKELEKGGYIKRVAKDLYFKINGWIPIADEIIAIEAKLKDWKRGFLQANRYKVFANKVYLAIPINKAHLINKALLRSHNVGLIIFDPKEVKIKKALHPKKAKPLNFYKYNLAAEFFFSQNSLNNLTVS